MNNTDILELKKRLKKENSITRINAAYVIGMEKKIQTTVDCYFSDLEESEQFKYLELIKKGFSGVLGKNLQTLSCVREEGEENAKAMMSLLALRDSELKDENMLNAFMKASSKPTRRIITARSAGSISIIMISKAAFQECSARSPNALMMKPINRTTAVAGSSIPMQKRCFFQKEGLASWHPQGRRII